MVVSRDIMAYYMYILLHIYIYTYCYIYSVSLYPLALKHGSWFRFPGSMVSDMFDAHLVPEFPSQPSLVGG